MNRIFASTPRSIQLAALGAFACAAFQGLPARAAEETAAPAAPAASPAIVQGDHEFLQRIESHIATTGDAPIAPAQSAPATPRRSAAASVESRTPAPITEQPVAAVRTETPVQREAVPPQSAPTPVYTKSARPESVRREAVVSSNPEVASSTGRDVETRRVTATRPNPTRIVTATRSQPVELSDDAAIAEMPGATVRVQRVRPYVIEEPPVVSERRTLYPGEEIATERAEPEYIEIRPRHHGFFHRLFRGRD